MKTKLTNERLFDFRIKYNAGSIHSAVDNYHYFNAYTSKQALYFHEQMVAKKNLEMQTISVEKFNPYSKKWELEITQTQEPQD